MSIEHRICVIGGAGHVGLPLSLLFAGNGFEVDILDVNKEALALIASGKMPFKEEGADALLQELLPTGRLHLTSDDAAIRNATAVVCIIGTPVDEYLKPKVYQFWQTLKGFLPHMKDGQTLILRSTLYPGVSERVQEMLEDEGLGVHVAFCPERIAQGYMIREQPQLPQIISAFDREGLKTVREIFGKISREVIEVRPIEAELAKLFCNSYRYITFAVANQFEALCRRAGVDFSRVHHAVTHNYPRTAGFPRPGFAAGPCLLKDTMQLAAYSGNTFMLGHSAMLINEGLPHFLIESMKERTSLTRKCVGILGMTFKADCDDIRDSLSFKLKRLLEFEAREVLTSDPYVTNRGCLPLKEVVQRADVIVVGVPHAEYRRLRVPDEKMVVDLWNVVEGGRKV
jgi:UDP-N-acetyl-D-mannosaminuronic acid dehydrogenase